MEGGDRNWGGGAETDSGDEEGIVERGEKESRGGGGDWTARSYAVQANIKKQYSSRPMFTKLISVRYLKL